MKQTTEIPLRVEIHDVGRAFYPGLKPFMREWHCSYNKLCHYIYTGAPMTIKNRRLSTESTMTVSLASDEFESYVRYAEKNEVKRYQIRRI